MLSNERATDSLGTIRTTAPTRLFVLYGNFRLTTEIVRPTNLVEC